MSAHSLLPVVVVGGVHEAERRRAVLELLAGCEGAGSTPPRGASRWASGS